MGCALVFSDYFLAVSGDLLGEVGVAQTLLHCLKQVLFVLYHNGTETAWH